MATLVVFVPAREHYLLQVGRKTYKSGDTFEASPEDAKKLVSGGDVRLAPTPSATSESTKPVEHSPDRAERGTTTRSEDLNVTC